MAEPAVATSLPIRSFQSQILEAVSHNNIVIILGDTGSGKTTQLPQIIEDCGLVKEGYQIGITQPRRVAAVSVARRVAKERNVQVGQEVGYKVRFEDNTSKTTKISYMTDGLLLRELYEDPILAKYAVIILDEAHERPLNADILFALLKELAVGPRKAMNEDLPPLKLIIMSATLEVDKFRNYFCNCPVLSIPGRQYPVKVIHSLEDQTADYESSAIDLVLDIHCSQPPGDILVFLTGQVEIERACKALHLAICSLDRQSCGDLLILPLFASLPPDIQSQVFAPPPIGARRCIIATNIAETSVTIDGIVYVIDSGVFKQKEYDPETGIDSLKVRCISKVQATQRAGRAGRTRPGICYRLYTHDTFDSMIDTASPEINRTCLSGAVLYLKSLPVEINVLEFNFIDKPEREGLEDALRQLYILDAIDQNGVIREMGRSMARLPLDPCLARAVLAARSLDCIDDVVTVVSMLSQESKSYIRNIQKNPTFVDSSSKEIVFAPEIRGLMSDMLGDLPFLLRLYTAWRSHKDDRQWCNTAGINKKSMHFANDIRTQILGLLKGEDGRDSLPFGAPVPKRELSRMDKLRLCMARGFATKIARRMKQHNGYKTVSSRPVLAQIHPCISNLQVDDEGLMPEWIIYHSIISTSKRKILAGVLPIESEWVEDIVERFKVVDSLDLAGHSKPNLYSKFEKERTEQSMNASQPLGMKGTNIKVQSSVGRRNDEGSISAARERYLARREVKRKR
jgi:ATP-dependent RNA helicase DHX8/PRP22